MAALMKQTQWLIRGLWLAAILLAAHLTGLPAQAQAQDAREIIVLEATGPVIPPFASYLQRGIDTADSRNAEAVVVLLNTPGGNVGTMMDIVQSFRASDGRLRGPDFLGGLLVGESGSQWAEIPTY